MVNHVLKYNVSNFSHQFPLLRGRSQLPIQTDIVIISLDSQEDASMSWKSSLLIQKMLMQEDLLTTHELLSMYNQTGTSGFFRDSME